MAEAARDAFVETLPASPTFVAVRIGVIALLIPIFWLWLGTVAAVAIAVVLAPLLALVAPRALVLDDEGFRMLSLVPRRKVLSGARRHRAPVRLGCAEKRRRWH
jgi:hypothetical protein